MAMRPSVSPLPSSKAPLRPSCAGSEPAKMAGRCCPRLSLGNFNLPSWCVAMKSLIACGGCASARLIRKKPGRGMASSAPALAAGSVDQPASSQRPQSSAARRAFSSTFKPGLSQSKGSSSFLPFSFTGTLGLPGLLVLEDDPPPRGSMSEAEGKTGEGPLGDCTSGPSALGMVSSCWSQRRRCSRLSSLLRNVLNEARRKIWHLTFFDSAITKARLALATLPFSCQL
mmetsp:Transcript_30399/g.68224  ORF Transcript_30399/g.68224 Transcript_30399/m.68224 type:complete len:228 (-) Transcript_30399:156-839(-)